MQKPSSLSKLNEEQGTVAVSIPRYNINHISLTPSPTHDGQPRIFHPGMLFDTETYERIQTEVNNNRRLNVLMIKEEEEEEEQAQEQVEESSNNNNDDDDDHINNNTKKIQNKSNVAIFNEKVIEQRREEEIQQLTQIVLHNQPKDDPIADLLLEQINHILQESISVIETTANEPKEQAKLTAPIAATAAPVAATVAAAAVVVATTTSSPYPPRNQIGLVADHDRPYVEYGHLDRPTIAQECQFNLQILPIPATTTAAATIAEQQRPRFNCKSFAITAWTDASKETVMNEIKQEFGIKNIQYICIGEEMSEFNHRRHLHIQIILKEKVNKKKHFLDEVTNTHCNYQVTHNDLAWNEYIKKGGDFIEFNTFKSTTVRGKKQWPSASSSGASTLSTSSRIGSTRRTTTTTTTTTITTTRADPTTSIITDTIGATVAPVTPVSTSGGGGDVGDGVIVRATTTTTVRGQAEQRRQFELQIAQQALELARTNVDQAMDLIEHTIPTKFILHSSWYLTTFNYVRLRAQQQADRQGHIEKEYIWPYSFPQCTPTLRDVVDRWIRHHFFRNRRAKCLILIGPTGVGKTSFALSLPGRVNYFKGRWNLDAWNDYARYSVYDDIPWDQFQTLNYPNKKDLLTQNGKTHATDKYRGTKEINVQQPAIVLLNHEDTGSLLQTPITEEQQKTATYWQKRAFIYIMGPDDYFYKHRPQTRSTTNSNNHHHHSSDSSMSPNEERRGGFDEFERMYQYYYKKHPK